MNVETRASIHSTSSPGGVTVLVIISRAVLNILLAALVVGCLVLYGLARSIA